MALIKRLRQAQTPVPAQQTPPAYTDQPTAIFYGDNPLRDEDHRGGLYTDAQLAAIQLQATANQVGAGAVNVLSHGRALISGGGTGGAPMAWERNLGSVNSQTGNRQVIFQIVSWPIRGGGTLDFRLYNNSKATRTTVGGYGWSMSYDESVQQTFDPDTGLLTGANIYLADGTVFAFG